MDSFVDERDFQILEDDKYTFFMLRRIIGGKCKLLLTDHERLIICYTSAPFPIWIWTPDDASREEMEKAYQIAAEHSFSMVDITLILNMIWRNFLLKKLLRMVKCCPFLLICLHMIVRVL